MTQLVFTKNEWEELRPQVVKEMKDFLYPYRTAVFEDHGTHGEGWGSGSYLRLGTNIYILTNEHVTAVRCVKRMLTHQFNGQETIRRIVGNHVDYGAPLDLGLLPIDMAAWSESSNHSKGIEIEQLALAHTPVEGELMTFTGFAGDNVDFYFNTLFSEATCYTAREKQLPDHVDINSRFHFGMDYQPNLATDIIGNSGLPKPPGLSGSTVWNTGVVEAKMRGIPWTPDCARVTGIIWGWPSSDGCLVATRVEYLRAFLLDAARILGCGV